MIYYRVCYFNLNPFTNKWETTKEYPLSEFLALMRVEYLTKSIPSLVWLEEVTRLPGICEECEHCHWEEEQKESYCDVYGILVPGDWSCPDFDNIK